MATIAAAGSFRRTFADPGGQQAYGGFTARAEQYRYYWHWYANSVYEDLAAWYGYRSAHRLYRHIRGIYNPARRLVDFYAGAIYPGVLSVEANQLPGGTPSAIPLSAELDPALRVAIGQFYQWSNWQTRKSLLVRYAAGVGDCLAEVDDDVASGQVQAAIVWPGFVAALALDGQGNVKSYSLEYDVREADGSTYTYRKAVDGERIATYRDDKPAEFDGKPAEYPNPYGFAPAVWVRHLDLGSDYGAPCYRDLGKWDELNMAASMLHDHLYKVMAAPVIVGGTGRISSLYDQADRATTQDLTTKGQQELNILQGPADVSVASVPLDIEQAYGVIDRLTAEIEADHPELTMYRELRKMSQVTGPAAQRLMGDVAGLVTDAQANYDVQMVKLLQMAVAIGGWRANTGGWGNRLTAQQRKFLPFDLDSYRAGQLDFTILPRPLIPAVPGEGLAERANAIATLTNAGAGIRQAAMTAGMSEMEAAMLEAGEVVDGIQQ